MKTGEITQLSIRIFERKRGETLEDGKKIRKPRYDFAIFCPDSNLDFSLGSVGNSEIQKVTSQETIMKTAKYVNLDYRPESDEILSYIAIQQDQGVYQRHGVMSILDIVPHLEEYLKLFLVRNYPINDALIIEIISDSPSILDLPWNTIRLREKDFEVELGKVPKIAVLHCKKYRRISFSEPSFISGNLKVLLATAYSDSDTALNKSSFDRELSLAETTLGPVSANIKKVVLSDLDSLITEINEFDEIDILHFAGHGAPGILGIKDGYSTGVTSTELGSRLMRGTTIPKNIVMNCCMGGLTKEEATGSFGYDLLTLPGLNSIIGMRYAADFPLAESFAKQFYENLVSYNNLYRSFHEAVDKTRTGVIMPFMYLS